MTFQTLCLFPLLYSHLGFWSNHAPGPMLELEETMVQLIQQDFEESMVMRLVQKLEALWTHFEEVCTPCFLCLCWPACRDSFLTSAEVLVAGCFLGSWNSSWTFCRHRTWKLWSAKRGPHRGKKERNLRSREEHHQWSRRQIVPGWKGTWKKILSTCISKNDVHICNAKCCFYHT